MSAKWRKFSLGELTNWSSGGTPSKKNTEFWTGSIPWISASSMRSTRYSESELKITSEGLKSGSRLAPMGSILLLVRGSILHQKIPVGIATRDVAFNQDVKAIQVKKHLVDDEVVDNWYLFYWLKANEKLLLSIVENTGIGAGKLDTKQLQELEIDVPSWDEQQQLLAFCKAIEEKEIINAQINQTLEQMAQAIFKSWFVDFDPVKAKIAALEAGGSEDDALLAARQAIAGSALFATDAADADAQTQLARLQAEHPEQYATLRATAELFPSAMQESELGEIPEGWSVCQVENILERLKPVKRYTKKEVSSTGLVPVFEQGADILLGFHNENAGFTADAMSPAFVFGDHTCITHLSCQNFDISQNVIPLRGRSRPTVWVYYAIQGKQVFQEYRRHWSELIVKPVIYPANDICEQYSETVLKMILLKETLERENR